MYLSHKNQLLSSMPSAPGTLALAVGRTSSL